MTVKTLLAAAILGVLTAACTGLEKTSPTPTPPTGTPGLTEQQLRFHAFGSPPPPGRRCPAPSRLEGAYTVLIGPTTGRPGFRVTIGGNTPLFNKAGHYLGPTGKIGFWFNLAFADWVHVYFGQTPPSSNEGAPVIHLGEANVAGRCSYRVTFRVPDLPPGIYDIVPIEHGRGGAAAFPAIEFRVTG
jgi:hypothetical protein